MRNMFYVLSLFCLTSLVASGQQPATLNVTVIDPSGKLVENAAVSLTNSSIGTSRTQPTNSAGVAVIPALSAGEYSLSVNQKGFTTWHRQLTLMVGQTASISAQLSVESVRQSVTVSENSTSIDKGKTESSQVIPPDQIKDLPIAGRDFIDFVLLTPTANVGRSTATGAQSPFQETVLQLSFGGLRETHSTSFGLDGADYEVSLSGVQHVSPSLDWVQDFELWMGRIRATTGEISVQW